jgi:hypothetical protein
MVARMPCNRWEAKVPERTIIENTTMSNKTHYVIARPVGELRPIRWSIPNVEGGVL